MELVERKNYYALDIMKILCAILIFSAHFDSEIGHLSLPYGYVFSLYIIAVPFFFCCSSFLFFDKYLKLDKQSAKKYLLSYTKRLMLMYLIWSIIYVSFMFASWLKRGVFGEKYCRFCIAVPLFLPMQQFGLFLRLRLPFCLLR